MRSSVLPIISLLLPFLGLWFLMLLADVIVRHANKNQQSELFKLFKICHKQLLLVRDATERSAFLTRNFDDDICKSLYALDRSKIENFEAVSEEETEEQKERRMDLLTYETSMMLNLTQKIKDEIKKEL